ncbi:DUF4907 domain-containing protein [Spirosoma validum]|uniref:DUF4907 domain-containing protein n=1 Tax=Spirosoma validum TaxID=2771355 RepID=A0A927B276_9BACT|nr:DUF4907 domain-containing protein [Spirosoma validum]MBD2753991.1 DUF4907 domain-containing protein [Spirosoma validum]
MSTDQSTWRISPIRFALILALIGLAVLTAYRLFRNSSPYQVEVFATSTGWGYDILNNGNPFIHQPTVPGQAGTVGFASQEQARRVGERVVEKLQETKALPTLTNDELRQLGVTIP